MNIQHSYSHLSAFKSLTRKQMLCWLLMFLLTVLAIITSVAEQGWLPALCSVALVILLLPHKDNISLWKSSASALFKPRLNWQTVQNLALVVLIAGFVTMLMP